MDGDALHAELAEIDENLIRANLTPAQEAQAIDRRKAIYVEMHPETQNGGDRRGPDRKVCELKNADRFTEATHKATGKSERVAIMKECSLRANRRFGGSFIRQLSA
jgi:hypothetical protein